MLVSDNIVSLGKQTRADHEGETMRKTTLALLFFIAFLPAMTSAQEHDDDPFDDDEDWEWIWEDAEGITITATRIPRRLTDTPVAVEVISAEEIENSTAVTLTDVLEDHGLVFTGSAMGDNIMMQGMGGARVLILVDGRRVSGRVNQQLMGTTVPLSNVERIEIIRGPQSALYGSDAIGGVINIITRRPPDRATFSATMTNRFLFAHDNPDTDFSPGLFDYFNPIREQNLTAVVGFPLGRSRNSVDVELSRGAFHYNEDASASLLPSYIRGRVGLDTRVPLTDNHELRFGGSILLMRTDDQMDAFGSLERRDYLRAEGHVELEWNVSADAMLNFRLYNSYYQRNFDRYVAFNDEWRTGERFENDNIVALEAVGSWLFRPRIIFTGGVEASLSTMTKYNLAEDFLMMDRQAIFFQAEHFIPASHAVALGLRFERNSEFGFAALPRISGMRHLGHGLRAFAGTGLGFRAPDFGDLYMEMTDRIVPGHPTVLGNPDLRPEFSFGSNVGLEWTNARGFVQTNVFHQELWDEMVHVYFEDIGHNIRQNIDRTFRFGVDTEARVNLPLYTFVTAGYGWVLAWDRREGEELDLQPMHTVRGRLGLALPDPRINTHFQARWFSGFGTNDDPRFVLDFFFGYQVNEHWRLNFGIDNLTGTVHPLGPRTRQTVSIGIGFTH